MTTIPKLFKRTSTGKIQEWYMEVDGNKYRTVSGQQDGKKVTSEWTTCAGKNIGRSNETTPEAQALAEANAKRTKKLDGEYKEKVEDVDKIVFWSPMLAEEYIHDKVKVELDYPVFVQPKLDGMRCIATKHGMFSRTGKPVVSCPHIMEALAPIFAEDPKIELDGELYNHDLKDNFDELISVVKQTKPKPEDLKKSREIAEFHVYDIRNDKQDFSIRNLLLEGLVHELDESCIVYVETREVDTENELDEIYEEWLEEGYEGQMIRLDTPYVFKRTTNLLKRKEMITDEFEVVDILEGKGNRSGMAGKVVFKLHKPTTDGEETCEGNPKGGFAFYKRLLKERKKVIGKLATVEFQNHTPKGSLRFPKVLTIRDYE